MSGEAPYKMLGPSLLFSAWALASARKPQTALCLTGHDPSGSSACHHHQGPEIRLGFHSLSSNQDPVASFLDLQAADGEGGSVSCHLALLKDLRACLYLTSSGFRLEAGSAAEK